MSWLVRCLGVGAGLLAAGCASPVRSAEPADWLRQFDAAFAFVPTGMESVLCSVPDADTAELGLERAGGSRSILAVKDFKWHAGKGCFPQESVDVWDFGPGGVGDAQKRSFGKAAPAVAGCETWLRSAQNTLGPYETWVAVVEERFAVHASSRELLGQALLRTGRPLRDFAGGLPPVDSTTHGFVWSSWRAPESPSVCTVGPGPDGPCEVSLWARNRADAERDLGVVWQQWSVAPNGAGPTDAGWWRIRLLPPPDAEFPEFTVGLHLVLQMGFVFAL